MNVPTQGTIIRTRLACLLCAAALLLPGAFLPARAQEENSDQATVISDQATADSEAFFGAEEIENFSAEDARPGWPEFPAEGEYVTEDPDNGVWEYRSTKLIVQIDGKTLVEQELDISSPRGLSFADKGDLFDETPPKGGRWLYGANPREDVAWSGWVFGVPADFAFDPEKLVIPFVRARTSARDEPQLWIHPCDIRYGDLKPGDDVNGFRACFHGDHEGYGGIEYWTVRDGVPEEYGGPWHCDDGEDEIDDDLYPADTSFPYDE